MLYGFNLNKDKSFEVVENCFFGALPGKEEFAVAKQHSFVLIQYPALCLTAQLVVICDHRLPNERSVPVSDQYVIAMQCCMLYCLPKYLFFVSFRCFFELFSASVPLVCVRYRKQSLHFLL